MQRVEFNLKLHSRRNHEWPKTKCSFSSSFLIFAGLMFDTKCWLFKRKNPLNEQRRQSEEEEEQSRNRHLNYFNEIIKNMIVCCCDNVARKRYSLTSIIYNSAFDHMKLWINSSNMMTQKGLYELWRGERETLRRLNLSCNLLNVLLSNCKKWTIRWSIIEWNLVVDRYLKTNREKNKKYNCASIEFPENGILKVAMR